MRLGLQDCEVDVETGTVWRDGQTVRLTENERGVLKWLVDAGGEAVSRDALLEAVWGLPATAMTRCVDTAVRRLRVKLERDPSKPAHLLKVHGLGYRLQVAMAVVPQPVAQAALTAPTWPLRGRDEALDRVGRWLMLGRKVVVIAGLPGSGRHSLATAAALRFGGHFGGAHHGCPSAKGLPGLYVCDGALDPAAVPDGAAVLWVTERAVPGQTGLVLGPLPEVAAAQVLADRMGLPRSESLRRQAARCFGHPGLLVRLAELSFVGPEDRPVAPAEVEGLACFAADPSVEAAVQVVGPAGVREAVATGWAWVDGELLRRHPLLAWRSDLQGRQAHARWLQERVQALHAAAASSEIQAALEGLDALADEVDHVVAAADLTVEQRFAIVERMNRWCTARDAWSRLEAWLVALLPGIDTLPPVRQSSLHQLLGESARMRGDFERADLHFEASHACARASGDDWELAFATFGLGIQHHTRRRFEQAIAAYQDADRRFAELGELRQRGLVLANLGQLLREQGELEQAHAYLRQALGIQLERRDPRGVERARAPLAAVLVELGHHEEAAYQLEQIGPGPVVGNGALTWALLALEQQQPERVQDALEPILSAAPSEGTLRSHAILLGYRGLAHWMAGRHKDAVVDLRSCIEAHQQAGQPELAAVALAQLAMLQHVRGLKAEALSLAEQCRQAVEAQQDWPLAVCMVRMLDGIEGVHPLTRRGLREQAAGMAELRVMLALLDRHRLWVEVA